MRTTLATRWHWLGVAALAVALAVPAQAQRTVTLRANTATLPDTTAPSIFTPDPAAAGMQVRGCLEGCTGDQSMLPDGNVIAWNDNTTLLPGNDGGDYWSVSFQIPDNQQLNFKFYSQQAEDVGIGGWEDGDNLTIAAGTGDVTLDLHYFNKTGGNQAYDWRPFSAGGDSVAVWFRVYMETESAITKGYDPTDPNLIVSLRGNFGENGAVGSEGPMIDWGGTGAHLTRESSDNTRPGYHLYSGLVTFPGASAGNVQSYKFYFDDTEIAGGDQGYEDGDNRTFTIPAAGSDTTLHWQYYSNSPPVVGSVVTASVTFQVDVEPLVDLSLFQVANDSVQVRGGFNGWDCPAGASDDCLLTRIPGTFIYTRSVPITAVAGSDQAYKYYTDFEPPYASDIGWEEPLDYGGGDRSFMFSGNTQTVGPEFYNTVRAGNVIPDTRGSVDVTFRVDMDDALGFPANPFDPAEDSLFVAFEDPVWLLTQGYEPGDPDVADGGILRTFSLEDGDGDGIYEGTLTVMAPVYNGIGYRYVYGGFATGDVLETEGAGGFGPGRRRYRYVLADGGGTFPSAFTFALDAFRANGPNGDPLPWEVNPTGPFAPGDLPFSIANGADDPIIVGVEPLGGELPTTALLRQNYPNPFNPSTVIEYAVPQSGPVTLVVLDLLGREVVTLVNEEQVADTYRVSFDARDLASGVYVYQLRTANTVLSQRMTLLK